MNGNNQICKQIQDGKIGEDVMNIAHVNLIKYGVSSQRLLRREWKEESTINIYLYKKYTSGLTKEDAVCINYNYNYNSERNLSKISHFLTKSMK